MPWKPDPNTCRVEFVLSTEQRTALGHAALDAGLSISAYCARAIMAHEPLLEALEKIAGGEAFTGPFTSRDNAEGLELKARIDYARAALAKAKGGTL